MIPRRAGAWWMAPFMQEKSTREDDAKTKKNYHGVRWTAEEK